MSVPKTAQDIAVKDRTGDVLIEENLDFAGLHLSEQVQHGLVNAGFVRPSPIQLKAIPLGRCGLDLIVQAKSGTGKTCVFTVIALEGLIEKCSAVQVLVLAPTREIAMQIWEVMNSIGSCMPHLKCCTFIGGTPLAEDKLKLNQCNVAIGTPGRMKQLIETHIMKTENVRLFVLDEADKLVEDSFQEQINWIYSTLPENKQMLALSATYPEALAQHLTAYMRNPTFVRLNSSNPALLGIRQYYKTVKFHPLSHKLFDHKTEALISLLSSVEFHQCLVFSNYQLRAQSLSEILNSRGWPAAYISGSQEQQHRMAAMASLKQMTCRILISTDLTSRGIDAENVNLVVNLDLPPCHETYLHRIGRAGRFGSYGAAVSFVADGKEVHELHQLESKCSTIIKALPDPVPADLTRSSGYVSLDHLVSTELIHTRDDTVGNSYIKPAKARGTRTPTSVIADDTSLNSENLLRKSGARTEEIGDFGKDGVMNNGELADKRGTVGNGGVKGYPDADMSSLRDKSHTGKDTLVGNTNGDLNEKAETKPKWKRNDVWTKLSYSYGAECKKSEERRKKGLEDDRRNDDNRRSRGPAKNTNETSANGGQALTKLSKGESDAVNDASITVTESSDKMGEKSSGMENLAGRKSFLQPGISALRGHSPCCRNFSDVLTSYQTYMADDQPPKSDDEYATSIHLDASVQVEYDTYLEGVEKLLSDLSEKRNISQAEEEATGTDISLKKPEGVPKKNESREAGVSVERSLAGGAGQHSSDNSVVSKHIIEQAERNPKGPDETSDMLLVEREITKQSKRIPKRTDETGELSSDMFVVNDEFQKQLESNPKRADGTDTLTLDVFAVNKVVTKLAKINSKGAGPTQKAENKTSPQDKQIQIRKYDRRRSPRKINQLQQQLIASPVIVASEGGLSESNTNSYPESESDYAKDQPSDSLLSETASSANDIKRRPPKKTQNTYCYPQAPWVPHSKEKKRERPCKESDAYFGQSPEKHQERSSSSELIESGEDSSYSETESEGSLDSCCAPSSHTGEHYQHREAETQSPDERLLAHYQAMQYVASYQLYTMHQYYASYYKEMCKAYGRRMYQCSAYMQQKDYIAKMAKWLAGKK